MLFKLFNRIETWELLLKNCKEISFADFIPERYDAVPSAAIGSGVRLYSAAYIMPSGGVGLRYPRKHRMHLWLLDKMMSEDLPARVSGAGSMKEAFKLLRGDPSIGDFLAYQFITDLNYSTLTDFNESSFVVPGPGSLSGMRKCFTELDPASAADVITVVAERQSEEFRRMGLPFQNLW